MGVHFTHVFFFGLFDLWDIKKNDTK